MTPMQQILLGLGAKKKTYLDDVFSTNLYKGTGYDNHTITNGINLSGKGGLVWLKSRSNPASASQNHVLTDTVGGYNKQLGTNLNTAQTSSTNIITSFSSTGFVLGQADVTNNHVNTYSAWSFRKAPGFFDIVTYTGNYDDTGSASTQTISHNLGSIPGCIIIKQTSGTRNWLVYHRDSHDTPQSYYLQLNSNFAITATSQKWNNTKPTSTSFQVGADNGTNEHNETYVAYIFGGGESTATTAHGVEFDGSDDYLSLASSSDFSMGTGDYTIECWFKLNGFGSGCGLWTLNSYADGQEVFVQTDGKIGLYSGSSYLIQSVAETIVLGQWYHVAVSRQSGVVKLFVNGIQIGYSMQTSSMPSGNGAFYIGVENSGSTISKHVDGYISNLRVVKGTGVYGSSFRPPTEPLTNITNTKFLGCNDTSATGSTVTPGTVTANSLPTGNHPSPFDDPAGFNFGDAGDQNAIKTGSYVGNGNNAGPTVELGWEPQWIMIKSIADGQFWLVFDSMRGMVDGDSDKFLYPNDNDTELGNNYLKLTPTGFQIQNAHDHVNTDDTRYVFVAIRRADGYVGKPIEDATKCFAMTTGTSGSGVPEFVTGFPVDASFFRVYASASNWLSSARLTQEYTLQPHDIDAEVNDTNADFDYQNGWGAWTGDLSSYFSWNWKRHAGFDMVTYKGNGVSGRNIPHSMGKTPEMIWAKRRNDTQSWMVYHKGVNSGSDPANKYLEINGTAAQQDDQNVWQDTIPTATVFTVGNDVAINNNNDTYIAMLFASVDGISKVGYYDGSSSAQTITTGFQPRFVILKRTDATGDWYVLDTTRGWGSGNDKAIKLNVNHAQFDHDMGAPTSTGFSLTNHDDWNNASKKYIYYAHA